MRFLITIICIIVVFFPVVAQDDTETVALSGAFDITIPSNWKFDSQNGVGYFWKTDDSLIRVRTYSPYAQVVFEVENMNDLLEFLVVDAFESREFNIDQIETVAFGEYEGLSYTN
jgi:hypothetical protein